MVTDGGLKVGAIATITTDDTTSVVVAFGGVVVGTMFNDILKLVIQIHVHNCTVADFYILLHFNFLIELNEYHVRAK